MNKLNQILLSIVLIFLVIAIPLNVIIAVRQHDAKLCDSIVGCHVAYKTLQGYQNCAQQYRKMMFNPSKVDATVIEKEFSPKR